MSFLGEFLSEMGYFVIFIGGFIIVMIISHFFPISSKEQKSLLREDLKKAIVRYEHDLTIEDISEILNGLQKDVERK